MRPAGYLAQRAQLRVQVPAALFGPGCEVITDDQAEDPLIPAERLLVEFAQQLRPVLELQRPAAGRVRTQARAVGDQHQARGLERRRGGAAVRGHGDGDVGQPAHPEILREAVLQPVPRQQLQPGRQRRVQPKRTACILWERGASTAAVTIIPLGCTQSFQFALETLEVKMGIRINRFKCL